MQHPSAHLVRTLACAIALAVSAPVATVACGQGGSETDRAYEVEGTVRRIDPERGSITIAHEDVPGYMPAMTMPFTVEDPQLVSGLAEGDRVRFRFVAAGGGKHVVRSIRKL